MFNELSLIQQLQIASKMVIMDAIAKGHTNKDDLIAYRESETYKQSVSSYIKEMKAA